MYNVTMRETNIGSAAPGSRKNVFRLLYERLGSRRKRTALVVAIVIVAIGSVVPLAIRPNEEKDKVSSGPGIVSYHLTL